MTDRSKEKETVMVMLRSLLLSSPMELPVRQVLKDYHSFVGKALDYRGLGYPTPEEFFRDIDDTVMIGWKQGAMTLRAVADEKTQHIHKLVSKQKVSSKQKSAVYRQIQREQQWQQQRNYIDHRPPRFNRGGLLPPPRIVPAYVRKQIVQLFRSYPDGIALKSFDAAFVRQFGCRINFSHYGFHNWEEFLDAIRDLVSVRETPYGDWQLVPLQSLIHPSPYTRQYSGTEMKQEVLNNESPENSKSPEELSRRRRPSKGRGRGRKHSGNSEASVGSAGSNDSEKSQARRDQLELEIQQVLEDKPDGVWASQFPDAFKEKHGRPLDYFRHGYLSVIEFVANACNGVNIERPTPDGDWKLYDARIQRPSESRSQDLRQTSQFNKKRLENETKENIRKLLQDQFNGVSMKEFPTFYKDNTGMEIPVTELGYDKPDAYFLSLADSVLQIRYIKGALMIYALDAVIPVNDQDTIKETPVQTDCPTDVVGPGCHYTPIMCPNANDYTGIFVSNIVNPGLFWVILRHKQNSLALEALMNDIADFYRSLDPKEYVIPESMVCPGQVCAVLFPEDDNWHRGVVTKINQEGFAGIYYVDYGNTAFVPKKTVKYLKSEFLRLPAQAIQARLANISPVSEKWKVKSRNRMLELVKQRPLVAFVTNVKTQVLSLCLTDTSDPDVDLHINDILVNEGFAKFKPDDDSPEHVTKDQHKEVPDYDHVFGWTMTEPPRLPHAASQSHKQDVDDNGNVQSKPEEYCYVKWLQLTKDRVIHLINLERVAYIVSAELSSFFWDNDILGSMLKRKSIDAKKRIVSSDNYPKLFEELTKYNVKSFSSEMLGKRRFISLYELNCVPLIIRTFLEDDPELVEVVEELITKFDPDSPYWKTCESPTTVEDMIVPDDSKIETGEEMNEMGDAEETIKLSSDEKQMVLQALQFKRKRILQMLMSTPGCSNDLVNELNNCELEIMVIKQQLEKSEEAQASSKESEEEVTQKPLTDTLPPRITSSRAENQSADTKPPVQTSEAGTQQWEDKRAETERVIQNILNSTTKPIATANIVTKATTSMSISKAGSSVTNSIPHNQFVTQSSTGSYQGMMGFPGSQQQGLVNPMFMVQPGMMPNPRMMNLQNMGMMMGPGGNMVPGMMPGFQQGLPLHMNPMFAAQMQLPQLTNGSMAPVPGSLNQMGTMPSVGRGQPLGILPGLLPLFQNLTVGRGRGGQ